MPTPYLRDASRLGAAILAPADRATDLTDTFVNFTKTPTCSISTLSLHEPFHPLCGTRPALLTALTSGGRTGVDAPYAPRGCDMRWFSADEICDILARFDQINIIGDSMARNLAVAMHVFLRRDLIEGPRATWWRDPDDLDCRCAGAFSMGRCLFTSAWSSTLVWDKDPDSMECPRGQTGLVEFTTALEYPLPYDTILSIKGQLPGIIPKKPHAFVFGHGLWNDLNTTATHLWYEQVEAAITGRMTWLADSVAFFPRLFVTPSAAGSAKPDQFLSKQGNGALVKFEKEIGAWAELRGIEHLGVWNLTVQNESPDGTHAGMRSNLIKAMMVFNWLDMIDSTSYRTT